MIRTALAALLLGFLALPALAQQFPSTSVPAGQSNGGIRPDGFANNSDTTGFRETSLTAAVVATGTTQATSTLLVTRTNVITSCPSGAGVVLPSVQQYTPIVVINRSGASCIVYPSPGATAESAPGTAAALNAGVTVATNTDTVFRPISPTAWVQ